MRKDQVVVAYDFSKESEVALDRAVALAGELRGHVLHFVTAIEHGQSHERAEEIRVGLLARLQRIFEAYRPESDIEFFAHVRIGRPHDEILGLAEEVGADLIIVGSHDRGPIGRFLLGSVSEAVLRGAHCPVLIARPKGYRRVDLLKMVEVPHQKLRPLAHRYSYSSSIAQVRPIDWPIS
jgi:nucleotide-binding universal stress UspA family protein